MTGNDHHSVGNCFRPRAPRACTLPALIAATILCSATCALAGNTYYIALDGSDVNTGSLNNPFASFDHAISLANPGDTIYVRGGTYLLDQSIHINKSGTANNPINLLAMPGENPVLDFSNNPRHASVPQPRNIDTIAATSDAIGIFVGGNANHWNLKGLTVQNAPYYGVRVYGSNNTFDQLTVRYNKASGLEITGKEGWTPSYNRVVNTDSYMNFDPQTAGEDADGFAAKFDTLGPGNVFSGVRAWSNSDDGFDFWHASNPILIENSWAFDNGFYRPEWVGQFSGSFRGDGMGFKLGQDADQIILNNVAAFGNKAFGIDANGNRHPEGVVINNATVVNNAKDGVTIQINLNDGMPHTVTNTIAFDIDGDDVIRFSNNVIHQFNTWNGIGVSADDFINLDMALLYALATGPRQADGSLPDIGLHLAPNSHLIDAGIDVGLPFFGNAPDLGAFQVIPEPGSFTLLGLAGLALLARRR